MYGIKKENRRRGPDSMVKAINIFAVITWILVFAVFFLITYGKPRMTMRFFGSSSDKALLGYASVLLFIVFIVCFIGILINMSRHKRKSDKFSKSLIFFGIASLFGIIYYFIFV